MCFANPVTMKGQWSLLLTRDQIVQQQKALLKKSAYKTMHLLPLPHHPIDADMKTTSRKLYWEVNSVQVE